MGAWLLRKPGSTILEIEQTQIMAKDFRARIKSFVVFEGKWYTGEVNTNGKMITHKHTCIMGTAI